MFDKKRFVDDEDSINIAYKLPRTEDQGVPREPMMTKLMKTKALSEDCRMTLIQRFDSNAKKEFFGILKFRLFSDVTVQLLAVEENHEVVSLRSHTQKTIYYLFSRSVSFWKHQAMLSFSKLFSTSIEECGKFLILKIAFFFAEPVSRVESRSKEVNWEPLIFFILLRAKCFANMDTRFLRLTSSSSVESRNPTKDTFVLQIPPRLSSTVR